MTSKLDHFAELVSKAHPAPWAVSHKHFDNSRFGAIPDADRAFIDASRALAEKLIAVARAAQNLLLGQPDAPFVMVPQRDMAELRKAIEALEASE